MTRLSRRPATLHRLAVAACLPLLLLATQPADADIAAPAASMLAATEPASDRRAALTPEQGAEWLGRALTVFFAFDEATLTAPARRALDHLAPRLRDHLAEGGEVLIAGHADATGDAAYNLGLSERRALAVAAFLRDAWQVPPQRLALHAWGDRHPRRPDAPAHAENRRVEITLLEPRLAARRRGAGLRPHPDLQPGSRHLDIDDFGGAISPLSFAGPATGRIITMPAPRH